MAEGVMLVGIGLGRAVLSRRWRRCLDLEGVWTGLGL